MAKARLTKAGAILLAKAIAGTQLTFTRGAFGDAAGSSSVSDKTIDSMTSLINETMSLPIADFKIQNNQAIVTLTVKNESVTEGFRVAEGGLFALNPDNNKEILYAYFFDGNDGDFMPAGNADMQLEYAYEFITAVSNATNVTAIIDKSSVGIMRDEFEEHIYSANPHPNLDYVTHPELTAHSLSTDPHPNWKVVLTDTFNNHVNSTEPHPNWEVVEADTFNSHINSTDPHPNWEVVEADTFNSHINSTDPHPNWEVVEADTFNSHVNSTDPHPNWDVVKAGVGLSKSSNTLNVIAATDKKLGGIKVGKNLYMSGESLNAEAGEVDVESRLKQLEINQANLYILLEALNKFGVQGNLIMTEDFQTLKYTHTGSVNATVETEGKEFITDGVSFLRPNNFCVLSNGQQNCL